MESCGVILGEVETFQEFEDIDVKIVLATEGDEKADALRRGAVRTMRGQVMESLTGSPVALWRYQIPGPTGREWIPLCYEGEQSHNLPRNQTERQCLA
jgi:hypothetical protein